MTSIKGTLLMMFGILLGLCFGLVIRNFRALEIVKRCDEIPTEQLPNQIINLHPNDTVYNSQKNLLFVGVMTAKNFLNGRAKAVFDTWGKEIPGRIAFFSSENSYSELLPVVALKGVDDRYPPQKKSFMMLYYMYEHFIDKFEWFARTDDDVYVNTRKLEAFLRSIDSTKPQFIGQAGKGNSEEFGLLSLEFDENFCMGGPGVILSRETLKRVAPHIPTCLKNLYSTHEDVEIGRCVQKFAGIPCTWNYEMQSILHHNSSGKFAFTGSLKTKEIHSAITLHPVKRAPLMYRLHSYMQGLRAQELRQDAMSLHRDIAEMKKLLESDSTRGILMSGVPVFPHGPDSDFYLGDHDILGKRPNLQKYQPYTVADLPVWNFLGRSLYSADQPNPKRKLESSFREGLEDVVAEVMENINNFSRQRGRIIEFREMLYGYSRVNSLYGQDLILDLLLIYKKYRGKKMTVPVRRHLYIQRAFSDMFIREMNGADDVGGGGGGGGFGDAVADSMVQSDFNKLSSKVKDFWNTGLGKISDLTGVNRVGPLSSVAATALSNIDAHNKKIVFVLPLAGRYTTFVRFINNYREVCLDGPPKNTDLLIVFFEDSRQQLQQYYDVISTVTAAHPSATVNHINMVGNFSRGKALDTAARSRHIRPGEIVFFVDVDMTFRAETLDRIRANTIEHRQVYLPIVFSQYDPRLIERSPSAINDSISYDVGFFRQFGYGICAIFKSDIMHPSIDGFNTDINGWGLEDVKFLEKIIRLNQRPPVTLLNTADNVETPSSVVAPDDDGPPPIRLSVFRAPDPSLMHVFHAIECDRQLEESQYAMCVGTKANTLGSYKQIESVLLSNKKIIEYISSQHVV